jgi:hypothetical protein
MKHNVHRKFGPCNPTYTQDQQFTSRAYMEFVVMHDGKLQRVRSPWLTLQICDMIFCSRQGLSPLGFL